MSNPEWKITRQPSSGFGPPTADARYSVVVFHRGVPTLLGPQLSIGRIDWMRGQYEVCMVPRAPRQGSITYQIAARETPLKFSVRLGYTYQVEDPVKVAALHRETLDEEVEQGLRSLLDELAYRREAKETASLRTEIEGRIRTWGGKELGLKLRNLQIEVRADPKVEGRAIQIMDANTEIEVGEATHNAQMAKAKRDGEYKKLTAEQKRDERQALMDEYIKVFQGGGSFKLFAALLADSTNETLRDLVNRLEQQRDASLNRRLTAFQTWLQSSDPDLFADRGREFFQLMNAIDPDSAGNRSLPSSNQQGLGDADGAHRRSAKQYEDAADDDE